MIEELAETYYQTRPHLDQKQLKLAVFYIATTGTGKTVLTQRIVDELGATYVSNDEARQMLREKDLEDKPRGLVDKTWRLIKDRSQNQFIVFDHNISATYQNELSYINTAKNEGYPLFIIAIDLPEQELVSRIKARGRFDTEKILANLHERLILQRRVMDGAHADVVVRGESDLDTAVQKLQTRIASMSLC